VAEDRDEGARRLSRHGDEAAGRARTIRAALRHPRAARAPVGALVGRLPMTIGVLVIVAIVHERVGSYALAGLASAAYGLAMAAGHPWLGRLADRGHGARVLVGGALACAAGWCALALCTSAAVPPWTAIAAAAVTGASYPPLSPAMRARWPQLVVPQALERAYAVETTVQEVAFVTGPLLLTLLLVVSTPAAAALACGVLVVAGAALFASAGAPAAARLGRESEASRAASASASRARLDGRAGRPLADAGVRALVATRGVCLVGLGGALVCIPAFALAHGAPALTGLIVACWSVGSLAGAGLYALRRWRMPLAHRYAMFLCLGSLPMAALALAPNIGAFALMAALSGVGLAPWVAAGDALVQRLAPPQAITEAFTWTVSIGLLGEALGAGLAGVLLDRAGVAPTLAACGAAALLASLLALATNRLLRPAG